jgi:hypothetical protein
MSVTKKKHIAKIYLDYVGIKYSQKYFSEALNSAPVSNTFDEIRHVLLRFQIRSAGITLSKEDTLAIADSFITTLPSLCDGFVLITGITNDKVLLRTERNELKELSVNDFFLDWNGNALLPEVVEESCEPNHIRNKMASIAWILKIPITALLILSLIYSFYLNNAKNVSLLPSLTLILVYCVGIFVCCLLVMESINISNSFTRKICHSGRGVSCSDILGSKSSKLFDLIGWSEIGLVYFGGNLMFFINFPRDENLLFLTSILALPYTIWSVMYQWFIAKKWCPLCLSIQFLLWMQFSIFVIQGTQFRLDELTVNTIVVYSIYILVTAVALWWIVPWVSASNERNTIRKAWAKMRYDDKVFGFLLEESILCDLPESARFIILGPKNAKHTITVISHPYCRHCASFHLRLMSFLKFRDDFNAEIVFVGEPAMEVIIKKLISVYLIHGPLKSEGIYTEWFKNHDDVFKKHFCDPSIKGIDFVYQQCHQWNSRNRMMGTPSIFINNRLLPDSYVLEDVHFLY